MSEAADLLVPIVRMQNPILNPRWDEKPCEPADPRLLVPIAHVHKWLAIGSPLRDVDAEKQDRAVYLRPPIRLDDVDWSERPRIAVFYPGRNMQYFDAVHPVHYALDLSDPQGKHVDGLDDGLRILRLAGQNLDPDPDRSEASRLDVAERLRSLPGKRPWEGANFTRTP